MNVVRGRKWRLRDVDIDISISMLYNVELGDRAVFKILYIYVHTKLRVIDTRVYYR